MASDLSFRESDLAFFYSVYLLQQDEEAVGPRRVGRRRNRRRSILSLGLMDGECGTERSDPATFQGLFIKPGN